MKRINTKLLLFVIGLVLIIPTIMPFFDSKVMTFNDETQFANLNQYIKAIDLGQFPPRWAPDMQFTYGSPFPEFNYQLPYYLAFLLSKLGFSLIVIFKLLMAISLIIAFCGFYLLALNLSSPTIALVSAILYTYTPYRAVNIYVRGSLGEAMAFAIFPFILLFLFRLKKNPNIKNLLFASISIAVLFLNHQPATILTLPFIFLLALIVSVNKRSLKSVILQILSGVFALILSAYYWIPVLVEQKFLKPVSPFNFYDHFPFMWQLVYSKWGYGGSNWGPYDHVSFQLGIVNQIFILLGVVILFLGIIKVIRSQNLLYLFSSLLVIFLSIVLMNQRTTPLWNIFPFTQQIQFPWRFLMVPALFTSLLSIFVLNNLNFKDKVNNLIYTFFIIATIGINVGYFQPGDLFQRDDKYFVRRFLPNQYLLSDEKVSQPYLQHTEDYVVLPIWATRPTDIPDGKITGSPETEVVYQDKNPYKTTAKVNIPTGGFITINNFYYPGWEILVDGKLTLPSLNKSGAMVIFLEKGRHDLSITYKNTTVRYLSNIISIIGVAIALILLIYYSKRKSGRPKHN